MEMLSSLHRLTKKHKRGRSAIDADDDDETLCRQQVRAVLGTAAVLLISCSLAAGLGWFFYMLETPRVKLLVGNAELTVSTGRLVILNTHGALQINGVLGHDSKHALVLSKMCDEDTSSDDSLCLELEHHIRLNIDYYQHARFGSCYSIAWYSQDCKENVFGDCLRGDFREWFGGSRSQMVGVPFSNQESYNLFQHRTCALTWQALYSGKRKIIVSSTGISLHGDSNQAMLIGVNNNSDCPDHSVCIRQIPRSDKTSSNKMSPTHLNYTLCIDAKVTERPVNITRALVKNDSALPRLSHTLLVTFWEPVCRVMGAITTFSLRMLDFNLTDVLYVCQTCDIQSLAELCEWESDSDLNINIALPLFPLISTNILTLRRLASSSNFLLDFIITDHRNMPLIVRYQNDTRYMLNFADPAATEWFWKSVDRFEHRTGSRVKAFVLPEAVDNVLSISDETERSRIWANIQNMLTIAQTTYPNSPIITESEMGLSEGIANYFSLSPKVVSWGKSGLGGILPELLLFTMFKENVKFVSTPVLRSSLFQCDEGAIDEELYIRWLSASVFLPAVQLPLPPWCLSETAQAHMLNLLELHTQIMRNNKFPSLYKFQIKPLWNLANSDDEAAFGVVDQFIVDDWMMLAPVMTKDSTSRRIYLPRLGNGSMWWDHTRLAALPSGQWINYPAGLGILPHFSVYRYL